MLSRRRTRCGCAVAQGQPIAVKANARPNFAQPPAPRTTPTFDSGEAQQPREVRGIPCATHWARRQAPRLGVHCGPSPSLATAPPHEPSESESPLVLPSWSACMMRAVWLHNESARAQSSGPPVAHAPCFLLGCDFVAMRLFVDCSRLPRAPAAEASQARRLDGAPCVGARATPERRPSERRPSERRPRRGAPLARKLRKSAPRKLSRGCRPASPAPDPGRLEGTRCDQTAPRLGA